MKIYFILIVFYLLYSFSSNDRTLKFSNNSVFQFSSNHNCGDSEFELKGFVGDSIEYKVFNRWGDRVFNDVIYNTPWSWNGYDNNNIKLPKGTYIYMFNNDFIDTTGSIQIYI